MTCTAHQLVEAAKSTGIPMRLSLDETTCEVDYGDYDADYWVIGSIITECARRGWTVSTMILGKRGVWICGGRNDIDSAHNLLGHSDGTDAIAWCEAFRKAKEATA